MDISNELVKEEVILERFKFGLQAYFSKELLLDVKMEHYIDDFTKNMALKFKTEILGQKLVPVQYPINWKESFKERWFPKWLLKKYPVLYQVIDIKALYPELKLPSEMRPVFHVMKRRTTIDYD